MVTEIEKINPLSCRTYYGPAFSTWKGSDLYWNINGQEISEKDLIHWAGQHFDYPWNHTDVIRQYHINAYAEIELHAAYI